MVIVRYHLLEQLEQRILEEVEVVFLMFLHLLQVVVEKELLY